MIRLYVSVSEVIRHEGSLYRRDLQEGKRAVLWLVYAPRSGGAWVPVEMPKQKTLESAYVREALARAHANL